MTEELLALFREGTRENLDELEAALLELRERPTDRAEVDRIFRVMHTIKGSAGMLGLEAIAQFAHALENEFDAIRTGRCLVTPALIELALQARDLLLVMIEEPFGGPPASPATGAAILEGFRRQRALAGTLSADWPGASTATALPANTAGVPAGGIPLASSASAGLGPLFDELDGFLLDLTAAPAPLPRAAAACRLTRDLARRGREEGIDSLCEFLGDLEALLGKMVRGMVPVTPEAMALVRAAAEQARKLWLEAMVEPDPAVEIDPAALLAALERPLQIRQQIRHHLELLELAAPPLREGTWSIRLALVSDQIPGEARAEPWWSKHLDPLGQLVSCQPVFGSSAATIQLGLVTDATAEGIQTFLQQLLGPALLTMDMRSNPEASTARAATTATGQDQPRPASCSTAEGAPPQTEAPPEVQRLGEILLARGEVSPTALAQSLAEQKPLGERLVAAGAVRPAAVDEALAEQRRQREMRDRQMRAAGLSSIRVSTQKLDKLVNLIGELVTVQERLSQATRTLLDLRKHEIVRLVQKLDLAGIAEEVNRLTSGLRDNALSIRMMPIESTFSKFRRLVHDLSASLGKEIDLTMSGTETEIDKTVIDRLDEPLVHLIRNCADHGIEPPEVRERAGKPRRGTIHLAAGHVGGNVLIRISDDGAGLDRERIVRKAIERGLITSEALLSDREVFALILQPGFSTAERVTDLSGRGVGMDVVKRTIEDLRGTLEIASRPGQGTTFEITLPLTLAIIDGLRVKVGHQDFILPLSAVRECVELRGTRSGAAVTQNLIEVRGSLIPFLRLRERFRIVGEPPASEQVIITLLGDQPLGLAVDAVIGEHKTVIKPLGKIFRRVPEFSGATILGDGTIAVILDPVRLGKACQGAGQPAER